MFYRPHTHQDIQLPLDIFSYNSYTYICLVCSAHADISVYFNGKKRTEAVLQETQSLHDVGTKERQWEKSGWCFGSSPFSSDSLNTRCQFSPSSFNFFILQFSALLPGLPASPCEQPCCSNISRSLPCVDPSFRSYFARCRGHHARHPTRHSSVGSQKNLKKKKEWKNISSLCQFILPIIYDKENASLKKKWEKSGGWGELRNYFKHAVEMVYVRQAGFYTHLWWN